MIRVRALTFLAVAVSAAACTNTPTAPPTSVRDRLETDGARLVIAAVESSGSVTAQRRGSGGWEAGVVELAVLHGELSARADGRGTITIEQMSIDLGPIEIPKSVLGYPAALTEVHLELERPVGVTTEWTGDDEASAMAPVELALSWSLTIDGKTSPLGAPNLPPVPVGFEFTGDGSRVRVEARAVAAGTVWSWADLLKLEDLNLVLGAATVTP